MTFEKKMQEVKRVLTPAGRSQPLLPLSIMGYPAPRIPGDLKLSKMQVKHLFCNYDTECSKAEPLQLKLTPLSSPSWPLLPLLNAYSTVSHLWAEAV